MILQIHIQLQSPKQGDLFVTQFLHKAKALSDELMTVSHPFIYLSKNSTFNVFKCLNSKFSDLITKLSTHPASITFPELHNLFLSDIFINSNAFSSINISSLDVTPQANFVRHGPAHNGLGCGCNSR